MSETTLPTRTHLGAGLSFEDLKHQALSAFDALVPGEWLTLTLEHSPGAVLALFQEERKGQFDWTPTCAGSNSLEVDVSKRGAERGSLRGIDEALSWDHDRLDDLEARAFQARARGDYEKAGAVFATFAFGLRRHIRFEEELLFPEFETRLGLSSAMGPGAVMRDEHRAILECLGRIERSIGDPDSLVDSARRALHAILGGHNLKEENIIYPGTDGAMSPSERDALVARIQAL